MRNVLFLVAICGIALVLSGCSALGGCGCSSPCDCGCEPVYKSPCCPAPSAGMGWDAGGSAAPAPAPSCGGGSCGGA